MISTTFQQGLRALWLALVSTLLISVSAAALAAPALWAVNDEDTTVYVFGTIHVMKPETTWRTSRFNAAFKEADTLLLEVDNPQDQAKILPLIREHGLSPTHPLSSLLSEKDLARLDVVAKSVGLSATRLDPMRPWLAALSLATAPLRKAGYDPESGVDAVLRKDAASTDKPVHGLETLDQQFRLLASFPEDGQVAYLVRTLNDFENGEAQLNLLIKAWVDGDVAAVEQIGVRPMRALSERVYQTLLIERNRNWADQIALIMGKPGKVFVAVGALHLAGDDNLLQVLKTNGLSIERIQ
ncbi:MAG: TraB/GumN family protein [Asticcacaulis sp.]